MSEPITPRGFEPRSLKHSLGRRPTAPRSPTSAGQSSPGEAPPDQSPVDVPRPAAATTAQDPGQTAFPHVVGEPAVAQPQVAGKQPRSKGTKTSRDAQHKPATQAPRPSSPADVRGRPRAPRGQIVFYLPVELSRQLRAAAHQQSKTHADVIFDAIESRLDDLDALLHEEEPAPPAAGVFTRNEAKPAEPKVQVSGQIRADNLKVIDRLVEQHGADSRSQLVEVALRAHLDGFDASSR